MKRSIFLISFLLITVSVIWGQGQISRRKQTEQAKKETPQQTHKTEQTTSEPILPNSTETINGITVKWNAVTQNQKYVITDLLNNMVYVEGGSFLMGSNDKYSHDDKPLHKEYVNSFRIGKYEVTQEIWTAIMNYNPAKFKGKNIPIENVSWNKFQEFISIINQMTGLKFRLPTEAEWEYAANGGNQFSNYLYSGGNYLDNVAWYEDNSDGVPHPVGLKNPNELGIYDMTGNIREFTSQKYSENYNTPRNSEYYVARGGGFNDYSNIMKITSRGGAFLYPNMDFPDIGIRLVL